MGHDRPNLVDLPGLGLVRHNHEAVPLSKVLQNGRDRRSSELPVVDVEGMGSPLLGLDEGAVEIKEGQLRMGGGLKIEKVFHCLWLCV